MTICKACSTDKPPEEFYSGNKTYCRPCWRAKMKAHRSAHREEYATRDRTRNQRPERIAARLAYAATERGREVALKARKKWLDENPDKRAAHVILGNAVRDGRVIKPDACQRCGANTPSRQLHAHHHDYALPLDVEWICSICHAGEHFPMAREARDGIQAQS